VCNGFTRAQLVLRTAVGFAAGPDQRVHWKDVHADLNSVLTAQQVLEEAASCFGTFMQYVLYQRPEEVPTFLKGWEPPQAPKIVALITVPIFNKSNHNA
jgi:hypothetical protein